MNVLAALRSANLSRLALGAAVLVAAAAWRAIGWEGHVFKESGRLPQLRAGDFVTVPLTLVAIGLIVGAFAISPRRQAVAGAAILLGLFFPLCSFPFDGAVIYGRDHHGLHASDVLALAPLFAGAALLVWRPSRTI